MVASILTAGVGILVLGNGHVVTQVSQQKLISSQELQALSVDDLTIQILTKSQEWKQAKGKQKADLAKQLKDIAQARKQKLLSFIEQNFQQVLDLALSPEERSSLPLNTQASVEKHVVHEGILDVTHFDAIGFTDSKNLLSLYSGNSRFSLFTQDSFPFPISGSRVRVSGVQIDDKIAFTTRNTLEVLEEVQPDAIGEQKTAVILFNFQDNPSESCALHNNDPNQPCTPEDIRGLFFTDPDSYDAFVREASYQQTWFTGDVFGWYTLPISSTCYTKEFFPALVDLADADIFFPDYKRIVFIFPFENTACTSYAGFSSIGLVDVANLVSPGFQFADGEVRASVARLWKKYLSSGLVRHELGHSLGVGHADALDCGDIAIPIDPENCSRTSDPFGKPHYTARQKEKLSWLYPGNMIEVTSSGRYTLEPYATSSAGTKAIKIRRVDLLPIAGEFYDFYLEYRLPFGFDQFTFSNNASQGVLIHTNYRVAVSDSHLIDATPNSDSSNSFEDFFDAALEPGQSVIVPVLNITITTVAVDVSGAMVDITFGPLETTPPSVQITDPVDGAIIEACLGKRLYVLVDAQDNETGLSKVELYANDSLYQTKTTSPYVLSWYPITASLSSVIFTAVAYDRVGNSSTSAPISISVTLPQALSAAITVPKEGELTFGKTEVKIDVSGCPGGSELELLSELGNPIRFIAFFGFTPGIISAMKSIWDTTVDSDGNYQLKAIVYSDDFSNSVSTQILVTVANNIDSDGDGFINEVETYLGTDPFSACPVTSTANDESIDALPPDFDDNQTVNILDVLVLKPAFNSCEGDPSYSPRADLDANGCVNLIDVLQIKPYFGTSCTP